MRGFALISIIILATIGCQSQLQAYVEKHTSVELNYGTEDLYITVAIENPVDFDDSVMPDLVWVQRHISETVLPDDVGLKRLTVFLPATDKSFRSAGNTVDFSDEDWGSPRAFTAAERRIVVFSSNLLDKRVERIAKTWIHELMHYIAFRIDGDMDSLHLKPEYWGKGGLLSIIFAEWLEKREVLR